MLYLVIAGVLLLVFVLLLILAVGAPKVAAHSDQVARHSFVTVMIVIGVVFVLITALFAATTVSARAVGIQTAFGRYQGTLQNGLQFTAPWSGVEEFPTFVQTMKFDGGESSNSKPKLSVKYNDGGAGQLAATVNWKINETNAKALWERFRTFERVEADLIQARATDRLAQVVGKRTSVLAINGSQRAPMNSETKALLQTDVSAYGVEIIDVTVTDVAVDDKTQANIQSVIAANQGVEKAKADRERAKVEAETAKIREQSGSLTAGALQRYCLDVTNTWNQGNNGPLPATWSCFAGGATPSIVVGH